MIVYGIYNTANGKWYVGQTIHQFCGRYAGNKWDLHTTNKYFKNSVVRYGRDKFKVFLLERNVLTQDALNELEKKHIQEKRAIFPDGYNFESGGQRYEKRVHAVSRKKMSLAHLERRRKSQFLFDKGGTKHYFENESTFAREHELDPRTVGMLLHGKLNRYKGWNRGDVIVDKPFKHSKLYKLVGPDGTKYEFYNMCEFARQHDLCDSALYSVTVGRALQHKGFHLESPRKKVRGYRYSTGDNPKRKYASIVLEKDGETFEIADMTTFCRERGLVKRQLYTLTSGQQKTAYGFKLVKVNPIVRDGPQTAEMAQELGETLNAL